MALSTLENTSASAKPVGPLLAMHARYEAAWEEYNRIDQAKTELNDKDEAGRILRFRYEDAMRASGRETDALQMAILYQVPTTWQEALVLQFHIHLRSDPHSDKTEEEKAALEVASDTLFDFMCDEIDHDKSEGVFHRSECIVSDRRRSRTGCLAA